MKLQEGDYVKLAGLTLSQMYGVILGFKEAGFSSEYSASPEEMINHSIDYLGVDTAGDIVSLSNLVYLDSDRRQLTYEQVVGDNGVRRPKTVSDSVPRETDNVNHPPHYTQHPSGVECIEITEHMGFNLGNAFKYIWRADLKNDAIEDLKKAVFYINREIARRDK